ncbi:TetR/AcrR family transcriptional regulator [Paramicrobacterium chengjingii]|uniref:TetR/AcrR family transcriptional regulator n=1 Tax=Paramicrobacterium chengjingii TaxID=2769067 RepID=UPI001420523E|nr:TetR/AcrR family transcriptional regulator [Microbacterium chengjingii]
MTDSSSAPRPRGRPARITRDEIVDAAATRLREGGDTALTMKAIATDLGVSTMALYRHVRNRDELIVAVLDREVATLDMPAPVGDAQTQVCDIFEWLYLELAARPWVVEVISRGDFTAPTIRDVLERILEKFVSLGLDVERAADAYLTVWRYTIGTLVIGKRTDETRSVVRRELVQDAALVQASAEQHPLLHEAASHWIHARQSMDYRAGLEALVRGLINSSHTY